MSEAQIQAAVSGELRFGDARSAVYRQGMVDVLRYRAQGVPIPRAHRPGTVEFDAYHAGNARGWILWNKLREGRL